MCNILGLIMGSCGPSVGCMGIISTISGCGGRDGAGGGTTGGGTGGTTGGGAGGLTGGGTGGTTGGGAGGLTGGGTGGTGGTTGGGTGGTTGGGESTWPCSCGTLELSTNTCASMCAPRRCQTNIDIPDGAVVTVARNSQGTTNVFYYNGTKIECIDEWAEPYGGYPFPSN